MTHLHAGAALNQRHANLRARCRKVTELDVDSLVCLEDTSWSDDFSLTTREKCIPKLASIGYNRTNFPAKLIMQYAAFLSYSHTADGKLAPALQSALYQFAKPWYRLRAVRVFRD
jgi:hypothetical protein